MSVITLTGRKVVGGVVEGPAFVTKETVSGWGGINEKDGSIIETRHERYGESFAHKILVFPGAKGSSGWSAFFHMTRLNGVQPLGMLFTRLTTKVTLGAVATRVPTMHITDGDPLSLIEDGDWVKLDANAGVVEITKRQESPAAN